MKLNVPAPSAASNGFPSSPRAVKQWLQELPLGNMGETTRLVYEGLRHLNRQRLDVKDRLEVMEMLRPQARTVLAHLGKHFVNRALPLPARSQKIVELDQSLLSEMAVGYKLAILDAATGGASLGPRDQALAVHRAMSYLGEVLLNCARIYLPYPDRAWEDIHQLYIYAETAGLSQPIVDEDNPYAEHSRIRDVMCRIALLAVSRPYSLRLGEADRLAAFVARRAAECGLNRKPVPDSNGCAILIDLTTDEPPSYVQLSEVPNSIHLRSVDAGPLISELRHNLHTDPHNPTAALHDKSVLGPDLSRRVLATWTSPGHRRFTRSQKGDTVDAAVGISDIHQCIVDELETAARTRAEESAAREKNADKEKDIDAKRAGAQTLSDKERAAAAIEARLPAPAVVRNWDGKMPELSLADDIGTAPPNPWAAAAANDTKPLADTSAGQPDAWDIVSRGGLVTADRLKSNEPGVAKRTDVQREWRVVNASIGGFCIRWEGEDTPRAQVGELIGLREADGDEVLWRVGTIRWMQYKKGHGLEVGVQLLAPKCLAAALHPIKQSSSIDDVKCLMLPGISTAQHPPSLLVPARSFKIGDEVTLRLGEREIVIRLSKAGENSNFFTQFRYTTHVSGQQPKTTATTAKDEGFDSLWSTL
ncbi:MAG: hypothetical protein PHQ14_03025 [Chromatiales bacterium]|nr:hypothetical protein [Chromatiales bacterium]